MTLRKVAEMENQVTYKDWYNMGNQPAPKMHIYIVKAPTVNEGECNCNLGYTIVGVYAYKAMAEEVVTKGFHYYIEEYDVICG
jgi:hypothetical protein